MSDKKTIVLTIRVDGDHPDAAQLVADAEAGRLIERGDLLISWGDTASTPVRLVDVVVL